MTKTYIPKQNQIDKKCFLLNADGKILGRLATEAAKLLTGKDETFYTPHMECGDQVVVINAKGIRVTGRKNKTKIYQHYTGYPGGRRTATYEEVHAEKPEFVITEAIRRMLPKNRMRAKILRRLHVYAGAEHRQAAQKPISYSLS